MKLDELYWSERSRAEWLWVGDRNTAFFHCASQQQKHTSITVLERDDGVRVTSKVDIQSTVVIFFSSSCFDRGSRSFDLLALPLCHLSLKESNQLITPFYVAEVEQALRNLPNTKAPGPNGMRGVFSKKIDLS